jgi:hypothetical protein
MVIFKMKLDPNHLSSVMAMFIFFACAKKTNSQRDWQKLRWSAFGKRARFLPQECPRQKVFFTRRGSGKNRREKLVTDILSLVQGLFPATRMKKKENSIAFILSF